MYCLRKMNAFDVSPHMLNMLYDSVVSNVWKYCITCWGGNVRGKDRKRVDGLIRQAGRVIGDRLPDFVNVYHNWVRKKLNKIMDDNSHPLFNIFSSVVSERRGRMLLPKAKTNRHKLSFVVQAMKIYSENHRR